MALYVKFQEVKPIPEGVYVARVDGFEQGTHEKYGETLKWTFTIQDTRSEVHGATVTAMCSTKVSPKSKLFSWLQAFGVMLEVDQQFDIESLLGQLCRVRVKNNTQTKIVNGTEKTITYSNVDGLASYIPQQTQQAPPQQSQTPPASSPQKKTVQFNPPQPSQATTVPQSQLDADEEFDF